MLVKRQNCKNNKQRKKYNEIMNQAAEMELADDMSGYMKQHLDSVLKGEPKFRIWKN